MIRLNLKRDLIIDCCDLFSKLSHYENCIDNRFKRLARKSIYKDFKIGLKKIENKCDVYIELPKYEKMGNGMYKENNDIIENNEEIIVNSCELEHNNNILIEYDNKN